MSFYKGYQDLLTQPSHPGKLNPTSGRAPSIYRHASNMRNLVNSCSRDRPQFKFSLYLIRRISFGMCNECSCSPQPSSGADGCIAKWLFCRMVLIARNFLQTSMEAAVNGAAFDGVEDTSPGTLTTPVAHLELSRLFAMVDVVWMGNVESFEMSRPSCALDSSAATECLEMSGSSVDNSAECLEIPTSPIAWSTTRLRAGDVQSLDC